MTPPQYRMDYESIFSTKQMVFIRELKRNYIKSDVMQPCAVSAIYL